MEARQVILLGLALTALGSQATVVDGQQATTDTVFVAEPVNDNGTLYGIN